MDNNGLTIRYSFYLLILTCIALGVFLELGYIGLSVGMLALLVVLIINICARLPDDDDDCLY